MGVPSNILIPFVGVEFDSSRAYSASQTLPVIALIIAQKTADGTGAALTQHLVTSADEVSLLAGARSMARQDAIRFFASNQVTTAHVILLEDAATAAAATTTVTATGTATEAGEIDLYINGTRFAVAVTVGDTAEVAGDNIVAAITASESTPGTAANVAGVITYTAANKGVAAGQVDIRLNYNDGESVPAGLTVVIGATTPGTVDPDIQDAIDAIGDTWYQVIAGGYNDATSLGMMEDFLETQAGPMIQHDGMYYTAKKDTRSNLITFATNSDRNCAYVSLIADSNTPAPEHEIAAAYAALVAEQIMEDTAVPLHRSTLVGILSEATTDRWTSIERNQLASNGLATLTHSNGVQTEATVTMYLKNAAGVSDEAYQQQNSVFQLMYSRYTFVVRINSKYPKAKLADSIDRMASGQQVLTPAVGKAEAISWFVQLEREGILENIDQFKQDVTCVRSGTKRLVWLLPPDLVNQFIVGSADMQFLLQSTS